MPSSWFGRRRSLAPLALLVAAGALIFGAAPAPAQPPTLIPREALVPRSRR